MTNGSEHAFPTQMWDIERKEATWLDGGLSKRELFAMAAMQGFLACPKEEPNIVKQSVIFADALLKELDRKPTSNEKGATYEVQEDY
ncbi:MAG: hypothetical protein AB7G93_09640 [Bdellovibrionales bacterium]